MVVRKTINKKYALISVFDKNKLNYLCKNLKLQNYEFISTGSTCAKIKSLGYIMFWHLPALFNPNNFLKNSKNIFSNIISCNMFCVHLSTKISLDESWKKFQIKNSNFHPLKKKN